MATFQYLGLSVDAGNQIDIEIFNHLGADGWKLVLSNNCTSSGYDVGSPVTYHHVQFIFCKEV